MISIVATLILTIAGWKSLNHCFALSIFDTDGHPCPSTTVLDGKASQHCYQRGWQVCCRPGRESQVTYR